MSTDSIEPCGYLSIRKTEVLEKRIEKWKEIYAKRSGVSLSSVSTQFAIPYLLNLALSGEGIPIEAD